MDTILGRLEGMRVYLPPVDAGRLKYFAALIMLIDHITCAFLERAYGGDGNPLMYTVPNGQLLDGIGRAVGRQAFPIFCFFLVEGFFYTRSRLRYLGQLLLFAALSQVPFQRCLFPRSGTFHANVLCTLAIGLAAIWALEAVRRVWGGKGLASVERRARRDGTDTASVQGASGQGDTGASPAQEGARRDGAGCGGSSRRQWLRRGLAAVLLAGVVCGAVLLARLLHSDYSYGGVVLILLLYLFRGYRIPSLFISWVWLSWYNRLELYAAPAFLLLACYNGKRGKQAKYFFYFFYPVHLTLLMLVRLCVFGS